MLKSTRDKDGNCDCYVQREKGMKREEKENVFNGECRLHGRSHCLRHVCLSSVLVCYTHASPSSSLVGPPISPRAPPPSPPAAYSH